MNRAAVAAAMVAAGVVQGALPVYAEVEIDQGSVVTDV